MPGRRRGWYGLGCLDSHHPNNCKKFTLAGARYSERVMNAHVGNLIVVRMPPAQALLGKLTESTELSEHGA
jgi:hypothetical protein